MQGLPVVPVIKRYVNSELGSGEEEPSTLRVFANRAQECRSGNAVRDQLPCGPVVTRSINVRRLIVEAAAIDGCVCDAGIEMRSFEQRGLAPVAQPFRGDLFLALATIAGEVIHSRVASRPDQIAVEDRWSNREHDTIAGALRVLDSWRPRRFLISFIFRIARIMNRSGEIGANRLPVQTAIHSLRHILRPEIKRGGINRGKRQGRSPRVTILALIDLGIESKRGPWRNVLAESSPPVEASHGTEGPTQINNVGITRS